MSNIYSTKNVKLVLRTIDLTDNTTSNNMYGTWKNVDIPNILGHMADEFEQFNLVLQSIAQYNTNGQIVGQEVYDRFVQLNLTGPPFVNQGYDCTSRSHNDKCVFPPFLLTGDYALTNFDNAICTFNSCRMIDIKFGLQRVSSGAQAIPGIDALKAVFTFYIVGVEHTRIHKRIY